MGGILKTVLRFAGYFFGFAFCIAGISAGSTLSANDLVCGFLTLLFGLWLIQDLRDKFFAALPEALPRSQVSFLVGLGLFSAMLVAVNTLAKAPPAPAPAVVVPAETREEAIARRNARLEAKRADLLTRRESAVASMKGLLAEKKFKEVVSIANEFQLLNDPEIRAAGDQAKAALEADAERERLAAAAVAEQRAASAAKDRVFSSEKDEMTGRLVKREVFESENTVDFAFPYAGGTRAWLELRNHPQFGKDVVFRISKGQLQCPSYGECSVGISIDGGAPFAMRGVGPEDNSSQSIFLDWKLATRLRDAKRVKLQVPTFQNGRPVFEFDLTGIDISRLN